MGQTRLSLAREEGELHRAPPVLVRDPLRALDQRFGSAPGRAFTLGPFEGELARGARGLSSSCRMAGHPSEGIAMRTSFHASLALFAACAVTTVGSPPEASADWPLARHDVHRTGTAPSTSNISKPVPYWRSYLGGTATPKGMIVADVDQDGANDIVYISGGHVIAKKADDTVINDWGPHDAAGIIGIDDLDGDGNLDLVIQGTLVYVLKLSDFSLEWQLDAKDMGCLGGVRMGDLDGDGKPDLLVQEHGCCGKPAKTTGLIYSFGAGFDAAKVAWTLPWVPCNSVGTTLFDPDGNGKLDVLLWSLTDASILDGKTGTPLAKSVTLGSYMSFSGCIPVNVDGVAGEELVCVQNYYGGPGVGGRKVFALKLTSSPPALDVLWQHDVGDFQGGDLAIEPSAVVDLDGDGAREIVVSGMSAASVWTTYIYSAATGVLQTTLPGQRVAGTAPIHAIGSSILLTTDGTQMSAWSWKPLLLLPGWPLPDRGTVVDVDWALARRSTLYARLATVDLDGNGIPDLVTNKQSPGSELHVYDASGNAPAEICAYVFPSGVDPLVTWVVPTVDAPDPFQIASARNDGFLSLFNKQCKMNRDSRQLGGYYSGNMFADTRAPVVASLDAVPGPASIVVQDSRAALVRLDAKDASWASPPKAAWSRTHTTAPSILAGFDGKNPGIAAYATKEPIAKPPVFQVVSLRGDGTTVWATDLVGQPLESCPYPGAVDAMPGPDLFVQTYDRSNAKTHVRAIAGTTGNMLWEYGFAGSPQAFAVSDWNSDNTVDVVAFTEGNSPTAGVRVLSGVDGSVLVSNAALSGWSAPMLVDVVGDASLEVVLQQAVTPVRLLGHDLSTLWVSPDDDRPYPAGAMADCPTGHVLVEGSLASGAQLRRTDLPAGTSSTMILAGGQAWPNGQPPPATYQGQLGDVSIATNLLGAGQPSALIGSTDGWLYALDPCSGALQFAVDFKYAVGQAVFGDTDGDGKDEILVSVADGYLYALKQEAITSPAAVLDTDPNSGIVDQDVDKVVTKDTLWGKWTSVAGATGYEVAVTQKDGTIISSPAWLDIAANLDTATVTGLPLIDGGDYMLVVRALNAQNEPSVDAVSDGVRVAFPAQGGGGGGAGGMGGGGGGSGGTAAAGGHGGHSTGQGGSGGAGGGAASGGGAVGGNGAGHGGAASGSAGDTGGCGCHVAQAPDRRERLGLLLAIGLAFARRAARRAKTRGLLDRA